MSDENRRTYSIIREPSGTQYQLLVRAALTWCDRFCLIERPGVRIEATARQLSTRFARFARSQRVVAEWPGTKLYGSTALLREYDLTDESVLLLQSAANRLYEWVQPARLEDLSFWRRGDDVWLATIAHEQDAYLNLSMNELEILKLEVPGIADYVRADGE